MDPAGSRVALHGAAYGWAPQGGTPVLEWNEALEGLHPGQEEFFRLPQLYVLDELRSAEGKVKRLCVPSKKMLLD